MSNKPQVGVGMVVRKNGRILLGKRHGSHGAEQWALPGGKVDFFEEPVQTARRELKEETGIRAEQVLSLPFWSNETYPKEKLHFVTLYMICDTTEEAELLEPHKCREWRWFKIEDMPENIMDGVEELLETLPDLLSIGADDLAPWATRVD